MNQKEKRNAQNVKGLGKLRLVMSVKLEWIFLSLSWRIVRCVKVEWMDLEGRLHL
jgi:hypothetical protein